ncbi:ribosomal protein S18 acetylase RimI-like enzyme [Rhodoferax ferrireducens]|uniref:Ribosomal protein S18 acetylase RimI-like enzyme n=1 Tax=Rhodoferax ferrireducens TaxID=192843 RepID=A0ABU2C593_9BURK|nr:GNAT family N-acetyltransferase [Rhodoferax ferrireducens]MDR7376471.1 ribosomal protein S18 acetylase RimI-like enzyme [Rhodoferax ferrireducens]
MDVRSISTADLDGVYRLLLNNGWAHRIGGVAQLAQLVSASQRVVVALVDNELVGFARAITDGISNGYISMVVVAEPFRRQGIGQALVDAIIGSDKTITWVLRAGRDGAAEFFKKLGFTESSIAMERPRLDPLR